MSLRTLFAPDLCEVAGAMPHNDLRMIENAANAGLREVRLIDVHHGDACLQLDSQHSRLQLFNRSFAGVGARCDYALIIERDQSTLVWLFDLKSSKRDASSAMIGLANGERLLKFCISWGSELDPQICVPRKFVRAVIYPRAAQIRTTRANRQSMDVTFDKNGTCRIEVDTVSGKARVSVRRLCG